MQQTSNQCSDQAFLTPLLLQTLMHWQSYETDQAGHWLWSYETDQAGHWLWSNTCLWCIPMEKSHRGHEMGLPQLIHIPVNCSVRNSVTDVQKCGGAPYCCKTHPSGTCGTAQFSRMSKYTASVTAISWKKNGLITPALANLHHMFYFGLSHLCSLTSCKFHDPQMQQLWWLTEMWKLASSMTCTLIRWSLSLSIQDRMSAESHSTTVSHYLHFPKQLKSVCLEFWPVMHYIINS
jgi:hypothetical protein